MHSHIMRAMPSKRKAGRPKLSDKIARRERCVVLLTPGEMKTAKENAQRAGKTLSEFGRDVVLK